MEEKELIQDEVLIPINGTEKKDNLITEEISKKHNVKNNGFKTKECKVIAYYKNINTLDINFDGYGIRIKDVQNINSDIVSIKYKGEIGKPNFEYKI